MNAIINIFDETWRADVLQQCENSWALDAVDNNTGEGQEYLMLISNWYGMYMEASDADGHLLRRLRSHKNTIHVEGVHELTWHAYLNMHGMEVTPIPTRRNEKTADFHVNGSSSYVMEITSLNSSETKDEQSCKTLDSEKTLKRTLRKLNYKAQQLNTAVKDGVAGVVVIFDYSEFSGLGVNNCSFIEQYLNCTDNAHYSWSRNISALVFIHRDVLDGRPSIRRNRSAVFHNPIAYYPVNESVFTDLVQHRNGVVEEPIETSDHSIRIK